MPRPLLLLLVLAACSGAKVTPRPALADAAPALDADAAPAAHPPPSKDARRAYRKHLAQGRKQARARAWGEAVVGFEAALAAIPHDGRALSELAWAAFNAGDYGRARQAGIESVLAAGDAKVKASALYNLGRVEEATAHKEQAAKLYRDSLALRPSKTVADRLAGLGKEAAEESSSDERFCHEPRPADQVCDCVNRYADYWDKDVPAEERSCTLDGEASVAPGLRIARAKMSLQTESILLVAQMGEGWSVVARLEDVYNPGAFGIFEEWELERVDETMAEGRRVVRVVTRHHRQDSDAGVQEIESEDVTRETLCVIDASSVSCPLQVPTKINYRRERLGLDDEEVDDETRKMQTPGLPISSSLELNVRVRGSTAEVVLVKGSADPEIKALLGPHQLY